jgi:quercetin dioxygenase-like cupin family protein
MGIVGSETGMKRRTASFVWAALAAAATAAAQAAILPYGQGAGKMEMIRGGSQPATQGPPEYFTGKVTIESQFQRPEPSRLAGAVVSFEPGARSAWHTHPLGQTLIVTAGRGWTQCEGSPIVEFGAGDILWCPPGHKHWHGATPTSAMTHIALQEALGGKVVEWMEKVTDEEYLAGPASA